MADLAVGLSKMVVQGALARVHTVIEEEAKLRQKVQRDLVLISLEFEMIQSFLNVTNDEMSTDLKVTNDEMSTTKNHLVRTWVRHVRELANDLEDCIEFVVDLDNKPIFWRRQLPSCIAPALPLDQAVMEIEELKGRAKELSECYMRYSQIADPASKLAVLQQQQASSWPTSTTPSATLLAKARDAARRQQALGDLTHLITNKDNHNDPGLRVISVWGTAGDLGTTSVITKAYNDPEICQNFSCRVWIKLMHPFDSNEFVRRFMAQVYADACKEEGADIGVHVLKKMKAKQEDLLKEFVKEVNKKAYLVVLENLTDMVDWKTVRTFLPDMKKGSWIIVSTQQFEIASLCVGHPYQPLELKQFLPDHSVCAFFKEDSQDYGDKDEKLALSHVGQSSYARNTPSFNRQTVAMYWMENFPIVGRETEMNELRRYTATGHFTNSRVVSVWGIAGIGKSALLKILYYESVLYGQQFNEYRWVDVSHPFNLRAFSRSLFSDHHSEKDNIKECREFLSKNHCLVIIDDLRSKEEWDLIQAALVSENCSSIIVVITTEANVATYCTKNKEQVLNVKGLEAVAAIKLFRKEVHRKEPLSPLNDHVDLELDELILRCGGLPKAIVALAALLATQTVTLMDTVRSLNRRFMHHVETNPEYTSLRGLFSWAHAYFRGCSDSLKPCIFYLSIFPRGQNIRRCRLVRRWIAEGYSRESDEESAVDEGENFFSKLLELSIIQKIPQLVTTAFNGTRMVSCQVNGFIREYIVSRRTEENLAFELGSNCVLTNQRRGRHLVISRDWGRDKFVFESIDFSRLRSLTVFGLWESFFISKSMRLLRVLDLEDALGVKDEDLEKMVKRLYRLKFLSLRGCSEIFHLPSSLGDLRQLQSLDVRHTPIVTLPASISKLQKLQYIRVGTKVQASTPPFSSSRFPKFRKRCSVVGVKVPKGIGKLTALHTLGVVNVGASGGKAIVEELKKLTQLRKIGVSGINSHNSKDFFFATSGHVHLESFLVQLDEDSQDCLDDISLPWRNLQSLKLYGLQDKLPLSMSHLYKLRKLELEMDTLQRDAIEFVARLPELCILRLRLKQFEDDKLSLYVELCGEQVWTFEKMKILEISCSSGQSLNVVFGSESMMNLQLLKVDYSCASYQLIGLNYLFELKHVLLKGADEEIKTALEELLANHPRIPPVVKLEDLPSSS